MSIDLAKRNRLIRRYLPDGEDDPEAAAKVPPRSFAAVPLVEFFDGNDDIASIAVNLQTGDGGDNATFFALIKKTLLGIAARPDVFDARCVIADCPMPDSDEDEWAYTDTVHVWTTMTLNDFETLTARLRADETSDVTDSLRLLHPPPRTDLPSGTRVMSLWWD